MKLEGNSRCRVLLESCGVFPHPSTLGERRKIFPSSPQENETDFKRTTQKIFEDYSNRFLPSYVLPNCRGYCSSYNLCTR